ncbi:VOC family protein [Planococcus sp. CAU13]|uniref:VOC family protein n=1 Tax=Planococcus sp. CAU13 TaxID=1541197 RepID=UPI0005300099|nr:VOC family protein [Planococcus sp. CAU13]
MFSFEHIAIMVKDMDKSVAFYEQVFGFEVRFRKKRADREMVFLFLKNAPQIEMELIQDIDPIRSYSSEGVVNHLAFRVEDLEKAIAHINEKSTLTISPEIKPAAEGKMVLFEGLNGEILQLIEKS